MSAALTNAIKKARAILAQSQAEAISHETARQMLQIVPAGQVAPPSLPGTSKPRLIVLLKAQTPELELIG